MPLRELRPYLMVVPALAVFAMFYVYPILYMFYLSTTEWNFLSPDKPYVGLQNYADLLTDPIFRQVLQNSFVYTFLSVFITLGLALLVALWLNRPGLFAGIMQGAVFSPYIISMVSVSILWMWIMDPQVGLLNAIFHYLGLPPLQWLKHPDTSLFSLVLVSVWKNVGFYSLVLLAGLQSITVEIYEAAALDRTPAWRTFMRITLPMLSPSIFFLIVIGMINSFQVFETISIMTQGGPIHSTNMLVYYIYENGFQFFKIGYASAAGVVLLLITIVLTLIHFKYLEQKVHYR